ncbi:MAG: selenium-dependent molybdenum cofactor biosynthesis protein YqeB [Rectinemataceae bacterium]
MIQRMRGIVVVRGAGDLATGVILRLARSGFSVVALEVAAPTAIRRSVAFSEAVYDGATCVEGLIANRAASVSEALDIARKGFIPVLVDPPCTSLGHFSPLALVDAILAKRNLGTDSSMAPIVVALGPGFTAPRDCHAVVETNRGHYLGRVMLQGSAQADTGTPGTVGGIGAERVVHAPSGGIVEALAQIGDSVAAGDPILALCDPESEARIVVASPLGGTLRGLIRPGIKVGPGIKVADVDPRHVREHCFSVSDKARAVAGGVLEAILALGGRPE